MDKYIVESFPTALQNAKELKKCLELVILLSFLFSVQYVPLIENCVLQMLVYEFMPNGTLRDHLSGKWEVTCSNIFFCFPYYHHI